MTFSDLQSDFADAVRGLRRAPGFTFVVVVTLSLGLGGTLATMSVMDRVLFRPPSGVREPQQLRRLYVEGRFRFRGNANSPLSTIGPSYPDFEDFVMAAGGRAQVAGYTTSGGWALGASQTPVSVSYVTRGFFTLLGVRPLLGRLFTPEELRPVAPAVDPAVLSAALWLREFGGDSSVVGQTVLLTGRSFTVVGIAPPEFRGVDPNPVDIWAPVGSLLARGSGEGGSLSDRNRWGISYIARVERGAWSDLLVRLTAVYREGNRSQAWLDSASRVITTPLLDPFGAANFAGSLTLRNASLAVRLMFVAIAVLVVSLLHGAIMLSLRAIQRRREIAIRLALGMPRARLVVQHACEAASIAVAAGSLAILAAWWGAALLDARLLSTLRPAPAGVDSRLLTVAFLFVLAILVTTTLVPALTSRRISPTALRSEGLTSDVTDSSLRAWLVAAETGACVALVMLAGLSLRSLQRISAADFGFDGARLITLSAPFGTDTRPLLERVTALPFVESASVGGPLSQGGWSRVGIPDRGPIPDSLMPTNHLVGSGFLRTAGIRVIAGRGLSDADVAGAQDVIVITRTMAEVFWPGASPLGQCIMTYGDFSKCRYVVGVVEDVRWGFAPARPQYFGPAAQVGEMRSRFMLIRTRQPALAIDAAAIEHLALPVYAGLNPRVRAIRVVDALEPQLRPLKAASTLFLLFGVLALISAAGGVYGLISYHVSRRTREIGVRMAMGASTADVALVVARWVAKPFVVGAAAGTVAALAGGRVIAAFLFETASFDLVVLSSVLAVVVVAALVAAFGPARRAATLDPCVALRHD